MSLRISSNFSPLQSPKLAIFSSIRLDALIGSDDLAIALRGLSAFPAIRLTAAFLATFTDFFAVSMFAVFFFAATFFVDLPTIVFTPELR